MSLTPYHLHWSDALIKHVELRLRQVHVCLEEFYRKHNYTFTTRPATTAAENEDSHQLEEGGPINSVGSFLLHACVHSSPFYEAQLEHGVGTDIVLKVPEEVCSVKDIHEGHYLERRRVFLLKVEKFLKKYIEQRKMTTVASAAEAGEKEKKGERKEQHSVVQWKVQRVSFGGSGDSSWTNTEKEILRICFLNMKRGTLRPEVFHVDVHFQPITLTGRIASVAAIRKHPLYSYLVLEDALMTVYLRKLHGLYSQSHTLLRATVFLKCWAYHVGLMSRTSGHPEGLSGFHISVLVLRLVEEGVILPSMSEENVVRAVWVYLSRGVTQKGNNTNNSGSGQREAHISAAEECGEVAVLRLAGETMNVLFRTSGAFYQNIIKKAAEEALQFTHCAEVFLKIPFQPLQLRLDACLVVEGLAPYFAEADNTPVVKTNGAAWSPSALKVRALQELVQKALETRSTYATVWRRSDDTVQIAVRLTSEAKGCNRLTRGPAVEDTEAVEHFNAFWGEDVTSTRQFADGGIYRCVLWSFDEDVSARTTIALSASTVMRRVLEFALRRHIAPDARVSLLLGGLEDVLAERIGAEWRDAAPFMYRSLMEACRDIEAMVADVPRSVLPCKITALDIIAPSERHTEVFPVRPHLAFTYTTDDLTQTSFAGLSTAPTTEPIHGVLRIDDNGKIPDTPEAIAIIKGAICAQLSKVLEEYYGDNGKKSSSSTKRKISVVKKDEKEHDQGKKELKTFHVRTSCTSNSVDIIYKGYLFRLYIAHYREVSLLKALQRNSEAVLIERKLFWSVQHAKFLRTIAFGHHSYSMATRLAKRWLSAMLLLDFVMPEAVELLVANAYLGQNSPKTPASGFMRFLELLSTHDWTKPLVLPYSMDTQLQADTASLVRTMGEQQGMFIATPYAPMESPFTAHTPRPMIMHRVVQLAKNALAVLVAHLNGYTTTTLCERAVFTSDPSAFDFYMPFHPHLVLEPDRLLTPPSTASGAATAAGTGTTSGITVSSVGGMASNMGAGVASPTPLRVWQLDELEGDKSRVYLAEFVEREPASDVVRKVRAVTRDRCMVFYDCLAPRGIYFITITPSPIRKFCLQLHNDILRVARGALLPASCMPADEPGEAKVMVERTMRHKFPTPLERKGATAVSTSPVADIDLAFVDVKQRKNKKNGEELRRQKRLRAENEDKEAGAAQRSVSRQGKRLQHHVEVEQKEKDERSGRSENQHNKKKRVK